MSELPKIVYDRLRALPGHDRLAKEHPDADLLAAFSEQVLPASERKVVLEHLALCEDCRDAIALALPPEEAAAVPISIETDRDRAISISMAGKKMAEKKRWAPRFAAPNLRWAALAAGVAIAASVLVVHPGKLNQPSHPSISQQPIANAPPAANPQIASSPADQTTTLGKSDASRSKTEVPLLGKRRLERSETPLLLANNKNTNEPPSSENALMARNDAPAIEKAKPALAEDEGEKKQATDTTPYAAKAAPSASGALTLKATWGIEGGVLQRSFDAGQTWQIALRADRRLLSYASRDNDVWVGGQAGALFHSSDGGLTWTRVQPSSQDESLSSDVTQIDLPDIGLPKNDTLSGLHDSKQIVLSTGSREIWGSADGGQTWNKR